jgi:hypothetical protein
VWHWAHLVLKIFSPEAAFPGGASANDAIAAADPARTVDGLGFLGWTKWTRPTGRDWRRPRMEIVLVCSGSGWF